MSAVLTAPIRTAGREGCPTKRTKTAPVFCEAPLGSRYVRDRVAAEPESVVRAGLAGGLGRCRADIRGHRTGQQSEHHDCCEPNISGLNVFHLAQILMWPLVTLPRARDLIA